MIGRAVEAEVLRLHHAEHWPIGTIARQLVLHHSTVRRVLAQAGVPAAQKTTRPSLADPFVPFITETLKQYPKLCASRLHVMVRERGYRGGSDHFRSIVARFRPRPTASRWTRHAPSRSLKPSRFRSDIALSTSAATAPRWKASPGQITAGSTGLLECLPLLRLVLRIKRLADGRESSAPDPHPEKVSTLVD